jgi:pathogenesis-related protein 1
MAVTCGNGHRDATEACEGNDLGAATCQTITMGARPQGSLRCSPTCTIDPSGCTGALGMAGATGVAGMMTAAGGMMGAAGSPGVAGGGGTASGGTGAGGTGGTGGTAGTGGTTGATGETGRLVGMTDATNKVRQSVTTPTPSPALPNMTWSPDIAKIAQAYADTLASQGCNLVHSHVAGYGENLAEFGGKAATPADVVAGWASEGACYTYGPISQNDSCPCTPSSGGACGHYTQLVWRGTTELGCGVATCPGKEVWVCNYKPPGNYIGQKPY